MKPLEIVEIYEAVSDDTEGRQFGTGSYWETYHFAQEASSKTLSPAKPIVRKAVRLDDGRVWVLIEEGPGTMFKSLEAAERERALNKLTDRERKLLGV